MASRNLAAGLVGALALTGATALAPPPATSTSTSAAPQVRRVDRGYADGALGNGLGRLLKQAKNPGSARSHGLKIDQAALAIRDRHGGVLEGRGGRGNRSAIPHSDRRTGTNRVAQDFGCPAADQEP